MVCAQERSDWLCRRSEPSDHKGRFTVSSGEAQLFTQKLCHPVKWPSPEHRVLT